MIRTGLKSRLTSMAIHRMDVVVKASQWAAFWKEILAMILWGVSWSIPIDILGRDLKTARVPKRDERARTVDVHALRRTFAVCTTVCTSYRQIAQIRCNPRQFRQLHLSKKIHPGVSP